jgi:hypothetical protein
MKPVSPLPSHDSPPDSLYQPWLSIMFNVAAAVSDPFAIDVDDWHSLRDHSDLDEATLRSVAEACRSPETTCGLIARLCTSSGTDLSGYTDEIVGRGLHFIFSPDLSAMAFHLIDPQVERQLRVAALTTIKTLYRDCLAVRCTPGLGHQDQGHGALDGFAYMFWDTSPIGWFIGSRKGRDDQAVVLEILAEALESKNIACVESALHGINHMVWYVPKAADLVSDYLAKHREAPGPLRTYALGAALGRCQ